MLGQHVKGSAIDVVLSTLRNVAFLALAQANLWRWWSLSCFGWAFERAGNWQDFWKPFYIYMLHVYHFDAQGIVRSVHWSGQAFGRRQKGSTQGSAITTLPPPESSYIDPCVTTETGCPAICWKTWDKHACVMCEGEVVRSCPPGFRSMGVAWRGLRIEEGIEWYSLMLLAASCEFEFATCVKLRACWVWGKRTLALCLWRPAQLKRAKLLSLTLPGLFTKWCSIWKYGRHKAHYTHGASARSALFFL